MEAVQLTRMADQIATFFASYPEEQAIVATAEHIRQFWDPRMRAQLIALLEAGGNGLSDVALAAARRIREGTTESADAG